MRVAAVEALGQMGEHAAPHLDAIVALLEDGNSDVRWHAVAALTKLGEHAAAQAGKLGDALGDGIWQVPGGRGGLSR